MTENMADESVPQRSRTGQTQLCQYCDFNTVFQGQFPCVWYGHACMRGTDTITSDDLYSGTAKSAEGYLAGILFDTAKEEGCQIEINNFLYRQKSIISLLDN